MALAGLLATSAAWEAQAQPAWLAEQAIERALPGVRARLESWSWDAPGRIRARGLELRARQDGRLLARLKSGAVQFTLQGLWRRSIERVELIEPHLEITPALLATLPTSEAKDASASPSAAWNIGEIECRYGTFEVSGLGGGLEWSARGKFMLTGGSTAGLSLALWDVRARSAEGGEFLRLDLAELTGLAALGGFSRPPALRVRGGLLEPARLPQAQATGQAQSALPDFLFDRVDIEGVEVRLPRAEGLPAHLAFQLHTQLRSVNLARLAEDVGRERQFVEVADARILSPYDPFRPVVEIRALGCEFTLAGLAARELEALTVTSPVLHVSEDLFWLMEAGAGGGSGGATPAGAWKVRRLTVVDGRLVVGSGGRPVAGLPLRFRTTAQDISLSELASLRAELTLEIPARDYGFPAYQLEFATRAGELRFSYPPETGAKNLVGTVFLPSVRWRQLQAREGWLSVTFDRTGINGSFGAETYGGYTNGGFSFLFHPEAPWVGWVAGSRVNLGTLSQAATPGAVRMAGKANFRVEVDAFGPRMERVRGTMALVGAGRLEFPKLDELAAAIPKDWAPIRQSATRAALEALRDYDYEDGGGQFWFAGGRGRLDLALRGPRGSRKVAIVLHGESQPPGEKPAKRQ